MKRLLLILILVVAGAQAFGQFTDTTQLNTYLTDTIKDRRPFVVTVEQLQKALFGISRVAHSRINDLEDIVTNINPATSNIYNTNGQLTGNRVISGSFTRSLTLDSTNFIVAGSYGSGPSTLAIPFSHGTALTAMYFDSRRGIFKAGGANGGSLTSGDFSAGFGKWCQTIGQFSFAVGEQTIAYGNHSVAMGSLASATGNRSFAFGTGSQAQAVGSVSFGTQSIAKAENSYAFGQLSIANFSDEFVAGKLNDTARASMFVIGNGYGHFNRRTIFGVDTSGTAYIPYTKEITDTTGYDLSFMKRDSGDLVRFSLSQLISLLGGVGSAGTLEEVTTAGNTSSSQIITTNNSGLSVQEEGDDVARLSKLDGGTDAAGGVLLLKSKGTGAGNMLLKPTPNFPAGEKTLWADYSDGDSIATRAYARMFGGVGSAIRNAWAAGPTWDTLLSEKDGDVIIKQLGFTVGDGLIIGKSATDTTLGVEIEFGDNAANYILPSQSGNAGKVLTTDGTNLSWETPAGGGGGSGSGLHTRIYSANFTNKDSVFAPLGSGRKYIINLTLTSSSANDLRARVVTGGSTIVDGTGAYKYSNTNDANTDANTIPIFFYTYNGSDVQMRVQIIVENPSSTTIKKLITGRSDGYDGNGGMAKPFNFSAVTQASDALTHIWIYTQGFGAGTKIAGYIEVIEEN